ncbi:hypothetical protein GGE16_002502 [Rhizobium leguminosarum]|uniref:Uncharacterized protein n=1 Tax=Rhizobium leguminosarum TaxID=384 RepID=A0AAE2MJJ4_RHILE|nr:hypothetical protein [Rhizobium leguminosarum]MBB4307633.1 hypothetical protein [Rhizobium leguminosarum]MBB4528792.1 hypothetical protein [Rhizobium leguminosarum]
MTMPDQPFDLAHPTMEMVPTATPRAALNGLITQQAVAELDRRKIPRQTSRLLRFRSSFLRLSRFICANKAIHRFPLRSALKGRNTGSYTKTEGVIIHS